MASEDKQNLSLPLTGPGAAEATITPRKWWRKAGGGLAVRRGEARISCRAGPVAGPIAGSIAGAKSDRRPAHDISIRKFH